MKLRPLFGFAALLAALLGFAVIAHATETQTITIADQEHVATCRLLSSDEAASDRQPLSLGRWFVEDDFTRQHVAIVSHEFWRAALHRDVDIIGRKITVDGVEYTVVGVAAEKSDSLAGRQVWLSKHR